MALTEAERITRGRELKAIAAEIDGLADLVLSPEPEQLLQMVLPIAGLAERLRQFGIALGHDIAD